MKINVKPIEAAQAIADSTTSKVGGVIGGSTAVFGITVEHSTVLADLGIFMAGVTALLTFIAGLVKRVRPEEDD